MTTVFIRLFSLFILLLSGAALAANTPPAEMPQGLWQAFEQARHQIEADGGNDYFAQNPGNRQRYRFHQQGLEVLPGQADADWRWGLSLQAAGAPDALQAVPPARRVAQASRIEYRRGDITEWYENRPLGLEQGFTLHQPRQPGQSHWLLSLRIEGGLKPRWVTPGQALRFENNQGQAVLNYDKLRVEDATGRVLPAHLALADGYLHIHVDARGARYPIVVDPLIYSEQKVVAQVSDAAANDSFGVSVALDGDTALIGAPYDVCTAGNWCGAAYVFTRSDTTWVQQAKLTADDAAYNDYFGWSVAISGDTALVGAWLDDCTATVTNCGSAYVFVRSGTTWTQQAKLTADDAAASDYFGWSVAISGNTALVGAYLDDCVSGAFNCGSAYVFTRSGTTWTQQAKLTADDAAANDYFGVAVALSGNTALLGAPFDDCTAGADCGSAYVFVYDGANWTQQAKLTANDATTGDGFGYFLALSGNTALLGAPLDDCTAGADCGAAYVFVYDGANWTQQAKLTASDGSFQAGLGSSIAIDGDTALVGAYLDDCTAGVDCGSAYVFVRSGTTWSQQAKLVASDAASQDNFGVAVAISGDTALVGAWFDDCTAGNNCGSAYEFTRIGSSWGQSAKLGAVKTDAAGQNFFGSAVAISGDTALVGAYGDDCTGGTFCGSAYVFVRMGATWTYQAKLVADDASASDFFGVAVALNGDTALVGAPLDDCTAGADCGSIYVFVRTGATWTQQTKLTANDGVTSDWFGSSVAIDGDTALAGSYRDDCAAGADCGSVYVFVYDGANWIQQTKLTASDAETNDNFGISVAFSRDTALVGAYGDDCTAGGADCGSAYVFTRSGASWTQQAKFTANDVTSYDLFGYGVAISGDTALVGAYGDDCTAGNDCGSAYVFVRTGTTWAQQARLVANDTEANDNFGISVALRGDNALVGAYQGSCTTGINCGSAYLFTRTGTSWAEQAKLTASDGANYDNFGVSVALSDDTALMGAHGADGPQGNDQGAAYFYSFPCAFGHAVPAAQWQLIASPCVPNAPGTVASALGDELTGAYGNDWILYQRDEVADQYLALASGDPIDSGDGYWLKSLSAARIFIEGAATPVSGLPGCPSTNGCYEVALTPPASTSAPKLANLVGHALPYGVDWADTRVVVDGVVYTLSGAQTAGLVEKAYNVWNGNAYEAYDDATPGLSGTPRAFQGLWLYVLPGAAGKSVKLLVPAKPSIQTSQRQIPRQAPWYLAWLDWLVPAAQAGEPRLLAEHRHANASQALAALPAANPPAPASEWYLRLSVQTASMRDSANVFGQLVDSQLGHDAHDLAERPPFGDTYLTIVFPHPDWGDQAGNYASDYRPLSYARTAGRWSFEVHSSQAEAGAWLYWQGDAALIARSQLIDEDQGLIYDLSDPAWASGLSIDLNAPVRRFTWVYKARDRQLDVDNNNQTDALTDGLLIIRHLFGLSGAALTSQAVGSGAVWNDADTISAYTEELSRYLDLDVDGNNQVDALTDGLLIIRFLFGLTGNGLTDSAVGAGCTRCDADSIMTYLGNL